MMMRDINESILRPQISLGDTFESTNEHILQSQMHRTKYCNAQTKLTKTNVGYACGAEYRDSAVSTFITSPVV